MDGYPQGRLRPNYHTRTPKRSDVGPLPRATSMMLRQTCIAGRRKDHFVRDERRHATDDVSTEHEQPSARASTSRSQWPAHGEPLATGRFEPRPLRAHAPSPRSKTRTQASDQVEGLSRTPRTPRRPVAGALDPAHWFWGSSAMHIGEATRCTAIQHGPWREGASTVDRHDEKLEGRRCATHQTRLRGLGWAVGPAAARPHGAGRGRTDSDAHTSDALLYVA